MMNNYNTSNKLETFYKVLRCLIPLLIIITYIVTINIKSYITQTNIMKFAIITLILIIIVLRRYDRDALIYKKREANKTGIKTYSSSIAVTILVYGISSEYIKQNPYEKWNPIIICLIINNILWSYYKIKNHIFGKRELFITVSLLSPIAAVAGMFIQNSEMTVLSVTIQTYATYYIFDKEGLLYDNSDSTVITSHIFKTAFFQSLIYATILAMMEEIIFNLPAIYAIKYLKVIYIYISLILLEISTLLKTNTN